MNVTGINGIWLDAMNCVHVAIYNVQGIYINGAPATGGSVSCDVRDFKVVIRQ